MEQANLPLISVIVSIYNVEKYLSACINSILKSTYENLEVLMIDDGSTDGSGEQCDAFCVQDNRCKVVHQKHQGVSEARNAGLRKAIGDYISFIDGDDCIHPRFYEILYNAINDGDYSFSMACAKRVYENQSWQIVDDTEIPYTTHTLSQDMLIEDIFRCKVCVNGFVVVVWNKLYKREVLDGLFFKNTAAEDIEFCVRAYLNTSSAIAVENVALYYYVQRNDSILHQPFGFRDIDMINSFLLCLDDIPRDKERYRGVCLECIYKTMLSTRRYAPKKFKSETRRVIKKTAKKTMSEFIRNSHIPYLFKLTTLLSYYLPPLYSFYTWFMEKPSFFDFYVRLIYGNYRYSKIKNTL